MNNDDRLRKIFSDDDDDTTKELAKLFGIDKPEIPDHIEDKLADLPPEVADTIRERIREEIREHPDAIMHIEMSTETVEDEGCFGCEGCTVEDCPDRVADNLRCVMKLKLIDGAVWWMGFPGTVELATSNRSRIGYLLEHGVVVSVLDSMEFESKSDQREWLIDLAGGMDNLGKDPITAFYGLKVSEE